MHLAGKVHEVKLNSGEVITEMHGSKAPGMWRAGEYEAVRVYLRGDVLSLLDLAETVERMRNKETLEADFGENKVRVLDIEDFADLTPQDFFMNVAKAMMEPAPDTSWMTKPMHRSDFAGWLDVPVEPVEPDEYEPDEG